MSAEMIFFLILGTIVIACSVLVLILNKISHRIASMAFAFMAIAGLYFLLRAEFIGIIQIMVYVGAVSILFIFGMMLTDHRAKGFGPERSRVHKLLSFTGVGILLGTILYGVLQADFAPNDNPYVGSAEMIGLELYGNYLIAFIGVGVLLLAALTGAIVLARKEAE
ncbi:NADH-quinone oxidoreductase subunit J [Alteribacter natronophilus]|uniref:NADH-quinone oxidoreductase subunit J n=1 Tax=Alteribacter natronophilus TaxID=2583810 RepID=UPI00110DB29C|nr:NADH-quinone oxidoreductase subunit J [Alteribacter natronophilus]TMW72178.1 NADH-quinone oxidoreductase subunit J [Alteribacter natronophilus]